MAAPTGDAKSDELLTQESSPVLDAVVEERIAQHPTTTTITTNTTDHLCNKGGDGMMIAAENTVTPREFNVSTSLVTKNIKSNHRGEYAQLKPQFVKEKPRKDCDGVVSSEKTTDCDKRKPEQAEDQPQTKKVKRKGQNKQRAKFHSKRPDPKSRLCPTVLRNSECAYGDKCKFSHDINTFVNSKRTDISDQCCNFNKFGKCPYSFSCRYAGAHLEKVDGVYKNVEKIVEAVPKKEINHIDKDVIAQLRKHKYDYSRANSVVKVILADVDKLVKKNIALNSTPRGFTMEEPQKTMDDTSDKITTKMKVESTIGPESDVSENTEMHVEAKCDLITTDPIPNHSPPEPECALKKNPDSTLVSSLDTRNSAVGPITNEDEFTIKLGEKKTINFKNKLYLAPLTTVGNLPFRRICKTHGADITCGEMAMATNILQGTGSEWALLKRHPSEDIFGVQLCGAYADSMTRCTQLLTETCDIDFIDVNVGCPIDMVFNMGAGSALMRRMNRFQEIVRSMVNVSSVPITVKIRTGIVENKNTAHTLIPKLRDWGAAVTTLHGRSREQRYTKQADWEYIGKCAQVAAPMPLIGGGDILTFEDYNACIKSGVAGTMIARGALIKPWIFTEIKEQRHWDISSKERLNILQDFANYGLEHWGSDEQGVETTRRFLLEWLSFLYRYIPVGVMEIMPQKINARPPSYFGRDDLETLMASPNSADWVKISEMLLGPVPEGFFFLPKHKANSY